MQCVYLSPEALLRKMFTCVAANLREREAHDLMRVFHFPKDVMTQMERSHRGSTPDALTMSVVERWQEEKGHAASPDELIRYVGLIDMPVVTSKLRTIRVDSQVHRL